MHHQHHSKPAPDVFQVRFGATDPAIYWALLSKIYGRFSREKELTSHGLHREILCMIAHVVTSENAKMRRIDLSEFADWEWFKREHGQGVITQHRPVRVPPSAPTSASKPILTKSDSIAIAFSHYWTTLKFRTGCYSRPFAKRALFGTWTEILEQELSAFPAYPARRGLCGNPIKGVLLAASDGGKTI